MTHTPRPPVFNWHGTTNIDDLRGCVQAFPEMPKEIVSEHGLAPPLDVLKALLKTTPLSPSMCSPRLRQAYDASAIETTYTFTRTDVDGTPQHVYWGNFAVVSWGFEVVVDDPVLRVELNKLIRENVQSAAFRQAWADVGVGFVSTFGRRDSA